MQFLILGWIALDLTNSASRMGLMIFLYGVPNLVCLLLGGVFADRFDRRKLLVATQGSVAVLILGLAVIQTVAEISLWHLYSTAFLLGLLQAINTPARLAIVSDLVGRSDVMNAVVLNSTAMNAGRIAGPALAGILIESTGMGFTMCIAVGFFAFGTAAVAMVRPGSRTRACGGSNAILEFVTGLRYCWSNPVTFTIIGIGFGFGFFGMPYSQVLPAFARFVLESGADRAGLLMTGAGIGSFLGTLALATLGDFPHKRWLFLTCIFLFGISMFGLAWSPWFWLSWLLLFTMGLSDIAPMGTTALQLSIPSELQGRVMSIWYVSAAFMFIGSFPMTIVADTLGWTAAFAGGAAIYLAIAFILGIVRPTLRRMEV